MILPGSGSHPLPAFCEGDLPQRHHPSADHPYGDPSVVACSTVIKRITGAWEHYQEIGEPRVYLVDTFNGIGKHVVNDGVHLNSTGLANWYQTLLDHAAKYDLDQ